MLSSEVVEQADQGDASDGLGEGVVVTRGVQDRDVGGVVAPRECPHDAVLPRWLSPAGLQRAVAFGEQLAKCRRRGGESKLARPPDDTAKGELCRAALGCGEVAQQRPCPRVSAHARNGERAGGSADRCGAGGAEHASGRGGRVDVALPLFLRDHGQEHSLCSITSERARRLGAVGASLALLPVAEVDDVRVRPDLAQIDLEHGGRRALNRT